MYEAIVLLPLLGAVIAGIICLVGARNRFPGGEPPVPAHDHAAAAVAEGHPRGAPPAEAEHAAVGNTHTEDPEHEPSAAGSLLAELTTSTFLVISCVLSWFAFFDVGIAGHEARVPLFSFITFADLHSEWMLRIDALTAVMLVVSRPFRRSSTSIPSAIWKRIRTSRGSFPICRSSPSPCSCW